MTVIAVAGGAGKLGRAIVETLVEQGQHKVVVLSREVSTTTIRNIRSEILLIYRFLGQGYQRSPGCGRGLHRRRSTHCPA